LNKCVFICEITIEFLTVPDKIDLQGALHVHGFTNEVTVMRKTIKTKKAFTLIEMVLVIAIILILSAVITMGAQSYLNLANGAASSVGSYNQSLESLSLEVCAP
jgi:type IV pilus assembly protein PilA